MPVNLFKTQPVVNKPSSTSAPKKLFESTPEVAKEPNYFQRIGTQLLESGQNITDQFKQAITAPKIVPGKPLETAKNIGERALDAPEAALRFVGAVAKLPFSVITEAPLIKQTLDFAGQGIAKIPGAKEVASEVSKLSEKYPELSKDLEDIVNIATFGSGKAVEAPINKVVGSTTKKVGTILETSGKKGILAETDKFVRELVRPAQTSAVKEAQVARTTEKGWGIFKRSEIAPTAKELASENAVKTIPGVAKNKTLQQNYNIIAKANEKEAEALVKKVAKNDFQVPFGESTLRLERASANLMESPLITGDAEKTAQKLIAGANKIIKANEETGSGLLKARKEYDIWVKSQKPKVFDAKSEGAFTLANREIRSAMNDLLEERAPTLGIKKSLQKQSSLFNAMENITPKAAQEADSAFRRAIESVGAKLGFKNKAVQAVATLAGIGGLGAASTFAPIIAQVGIPAYFLYKGGKLVLKPSLRKAIGRILKTSGKQLEATERNALLGILNNYRENK